MPQLDFIHFINQIFWLILFYLFFFTIILNNFIPILSKIVKSRIKKILKIKKKFTSYHSEKKETKKIYNTLIKKIITNSIDTLIKSNNFIKSWVPTTTLSLVKNKNQSNKKYLTSIKKIHIQKTYFF